MLLMVVKFPGVIDETVGSLRPYQGLGGLNTITFDVDQQTTARSRCSSSSDDLGVRTGPSDNLDRTSLA